MVSRPEVAQQLILAVYIEEPQNQNEYESSMRLRDGGFAFQSKHTPAMYFSGPWLLFLRTSPAYALATIIRITDFATDRWREGFQGFNRTKNEPGYRIYLADGQKDYIGTSDVYNWHRYMGNDAVGVESALMALEKWLYDRIDQKEDITPEINRILRESKSACVPGLARGGWAVQPCAFQRYVASPALEYGPFSDTAFDVDEQYLEDRVRHYVGAIWEANSRSSTDVE